MPEVTIEKHLPADPATVFEFVTQTQHLLKWWGPEGMTLPDHSMSFAAKGPWVSSMEATDGSRYKVSGQVTHVEKPHTVGFTWAWHDENDRRGVESHVTIKVVPAQGGGSMLMLSHVDLPEESAESHVRGWNSALTKLENYCTT